MTISFSRYLAIVIGILTPVAETIRRWSTWQDNPPALFDDYILGAFLLYGAWRVGKDPRSGQPYLAAAWAFMCGMAYGSFFEQLHRYQLGVSDPAPISSGWVAVIKGVGLSLGIIGLVLSLRRLPEATLLNQRSRMQKDFLNPPDLPNWQQAFSQLVIVKAAGVRTIYAAGQVSVDEQKNLVGPGDLATQAEQAFRNLTRALAAAGASTADAVKVNIYVKHYQSADAAIIGEAFRRAFPHENLPVSTWLGVETLAEEDFLIEIDAVAVVEE